MSDRLLTDEEIREAWHKADVEEMQRRGIPLLIEYQYAKVTDEDRAIAKAQDAQTHSIDEVEIREAMFKAVGEWLKPKLERASQLVSDVRGDWSSPKSQLREAEDKLGKIEEGLELLLRGEMPKGGR